MQIIDQTSNILSIKMSSTHRVAITTQQTIGQDLAPWVWGHYREVPLGCERVHLLLPTYPTMPAGMCLDRPHAGPMGARHAARRNVPPDWKSQYGALDALGGRGCCVSSSSGRAWEKGCARSRV